MPVEDGADRGCAGGADVSIEGKHAYRFGYLKSEEWKTVRIEALAREGGKCQVCGEESIFNDAHHIWYPENVYETTEEHLAILCRPCHELLHALMPESKTSDEGIGRETWIRFRNAIQGWQMQKRHAPDFQGPIRAKELREAYDHLKAELRDLREKDQKGLIAAGATVQEQLTTVTAIIKGWAKNAMAKESSCLKPD